MPKEEGQSALERRPGPSRQFPLSQVPAPSGGGRSGVGSFHPATFSTRRLGNFLPLKSQQGKAGRPREEGSSPGPPLARPAGPRAQDGLQTGEGLAGRERPPLPPNGECLAVPSTIGGQKEPSIEGVKEPTSDGVEAAPPPGQVKRHPKNSHVGANKVTSGINATRVTTSPAPGGQSVPQRDGHPGTSHPSPTSACQKRGRRKAGNGSPRSRKPARLGLGQSPVAEGQRGPPLVPAGAGAGAGAGARAGAGAGARAGGVSCRCSRYRENQPMSVCANS
uniref:Uncharacterized protein n=1 Tax=Rousettus aegyptiacus TaxID=9407 RepID=A0A7J8JH25_ROUAE|nr:hypothetical protein HJG63_010421 [Rousettus aegyptiacus]